MTINLLGGRSRWVLWLVCLVFLGACARQSDDVSQKETLPGQGADEGKTVIYRDTWGIPHIYAPTVEAGLYAQGYAQAEDRPEQLLMNIKIALGEISSLAGPDQVSTDLLSHMFDHHGNAKKYLASLPPEKRARLEAFAAGITRYYQDHPEAVPVWWQYPSVTPAMVDAFGRLFLYNWSIDEAIKDLKRGGIDPGFVVAQRASNQWAVAPSRSESGNAMLVIDPHLSWWGVSRFWEMRIHAGNLHGSGVGLPGTPFIGLGHNDKLAWAMTTGGPDTADVFELTLNPENENQYLYDGEYRDMTVKEVSLQVNGEGEKHYTLTYSHHGPVIARADGKAYAAAVPYDETVDRNAAWEGYNFAEDYKGAIAAAESNSLFPQNIMVADTSGNIFYQRVGRVPVRPEGYDYSRPVDGSTSAAAWQGIHPASDLVQILNPAAGYMQNCNVPPDAMMINGPFKLSDYPDHIYSSATYGPALGGWTNQRGARILALLSGKDKVTIEDMLEWAVDIKPYGVERWLSVFSDLAIEPDANTADLAGWDGQLAHDSTAALKYAYWRFELEARPEGEEIRQLIDDHYAIVEGRQAKEIVLTDSQKEVLTGSFHSAMKRMQEELGGTGAVWGRVFRVGRDDKSWPVEGGGGTRHGLMTLRSMGYQASNENFERWGNRGQTSTQVVELSTPIKSWIYLPIGQSDVKESAHYADQAEKLFQHRTLKPSWWLPEDLADHIASRQELTVNL
ncbi:MAG: penicillin acylase family protein [Gammaproteobacteria bacterium]|nr:penicillin acylase family protein [Gammaproteobacteria bacterium]